MKKMMIATLAAASVLLAVANQAHAGATLDAVQKKGFVQCGISDGLPGFSYADADGKFSGIDVDVCRGVAAAVFGDDTKVKYTPLTAKERFTALQSGEVDLLSRRHLLRRHWLPDSRYSGIKKRERTGWRYRLYSGGD